MSMMAGGAVFLLQSSSLAQSVTFGWSPNSEPNVAGYRIHYGVASRVYTQVLDVDNVTQATVSNLVAGTTYYFALTAYNVLGLQSDYTPELVYTVPLTARLRIQMALPKQTVLTVSGPAGRSYTVQASPDLRTWTSIGTVTISASGSTVFTENNPPSRLKRFYRVRQL